MADNISTDSFRTPILILCFNRPDETRALIDALRVFKPADLFISVDGPRLNQKRELDQINIEKVLKVFLEIDWPCRKHFNINQSNLGCKMAVTNAITWFFSKVPEGIILEDDCIPTDDFLRFAEDMLEKYRSDSRIMHISGSSYFSKKPNSKNSNYFSKLPSVWGWATWARAWSSMELIDSKPISKESIAMIESYFNNKKISKWFIRYFIESTNSKSTIWSTSWVLSIIKKDGLSVSPIDNLVRNIGFSGNSTHSNSKSLQKYSQFQFGKFSNLTYADTINYESIFDELKYQIIRKTDPNLFIGRRIKLYAFRVIYPLLPFWLKNFFKFRISKSKTLNNFFMK